VRSFLALEEMDAYMDTVSKLHVYLAASDTDIKDIIRQGFPSM